MRFEKWLNSNRHLLCEDAQALFDDSIKCYKNDIFRAAYLLAYQGVMRHLKEVILLAQEPPKGFSLNEWRDRKCKLGKQDRWDVEVLEAIKQRPKNDGSKDGIFTIDDDIRMAFDTQWRTLRNECAHHKGGTFIHAHVLVFYSFIEDHLMTISVEGGMKSWLREYEVYLDPAQTPPSEPLRPLLEKIEKMVKQDEFPDFIVEVRKLTIHYRRINFLDFLKEAFLYCKSIFKDFLRCYLNTEHEVRNQYIEMNPESVLDLLTEKTSIRKFWYNDLKTFNHPLPVLSYMLQGAFIQKDDIKSVFEILQARMYDYNKYIDEHEAICDVLNRFGYFDFFLDTYFTRQHTAMNCKEICYKTDFYISHLLQIPMSLKLAEHIIDVFELPPYPYTLRDRFINEVMSNEKFKMELKKVCDVEKLTLPKELLAHI